MSPVSAGGDSPYNKIFKRLKLSRANCFAKLYTNAIANFQSIDYLFTFTDKRFITEQIFPNSSYLEKKLKFLLLKVDINTTFAKVYFCLETIQILRASIFR